MAKRIPLGESRKRTDVEVKEEMHISLKSRERKKTRKKTRKVLF